MDKSEEAKLLYAQWTKEAKDMGTDRFLGRNRPEIIESLIAKFHAGGIPIDDVTMYKRKLKEILVTKEGAKGQNKYKNWVECVETDFDAILASFYLKPMNELTNVTPSIVEVKEVKGYDKGMVLPRNKIITSWAKSKFKDGWTESVNLICHTVGTSLNDDFCKEKFNG